MNCEDGRSPTTPLARPAGPCVTYRQPGTVLLAALVCLLGHGRADAGATPRVQDSIEAARPEAGTSQPFTLELPEGGCLVTVASDQSARPLIYTLKPRQTVLSIRLEPGQYDLAVLKPSHKLGEARFCVGQKPVRAVLKAPSGGPREADRRA